MVVHQQWAHCQTPIGPQATNSIARDTAPTAHSGRQTRTASFCIMPYRSGRHFISVLAEHLLSVAKVPFARADNSLWRVLARFGSAKAASTACEAHCSDWCSPHRVDMLRIRSNLRHSTRHRLTPCQTQSAALPPSGHSPFHAAALQSENHAARRPLACCARGAENDGHSDDAEDSVSKEELQERLRNSRLYSSHDPRDIGW